jgi:hypothetical protein
MRQPWMRWLCRSRVRTGEKLEMFVPHRLINLIHWLLKLKNGWQSGTAGGRETGEGNCCEGHEIVELE